MRFTLNSWKEIAQYVGKGVRTVQRWEQQLGLPIHRPNKRNRGIVLASTEEIDAWLLAITHSNGESELVRLRKQVSDLVAETQRLQSKLAHLQSLSRHDDFASAIPAADLIQHYARAVEQSTQIRLKAAEAIEMSHNLHTLQKIQRLEWEGYARRFRERMLEVKHTSATFGDDNRGATLTKH